MNYVVEDFVLASAREVYLNRNREKKKKGRQLRPIIERDKK